MPIALKNMHLRLELSRDSLFSEDHSDNEFTCGILFFKVNCVFSHEIMPGISI